MTPRYPKMLIAVKSIVLEKDAFNCYCFRLASPAKTQIYECVHVLKANFTLIFLRISKIGVIDELPLCSNNTWEHDNLSKIIMVYYSLKPAELYRNLKKAYRHFCPFFSGSVPVSGDLRITATLWDRLHSWHKNNFNSLVSLLHLWIFIPESNLIAFSPQNYRNKNWKCLWCFLTAYGPF